MTTANIFGFSDTWNDSGTTFNAIKVDVTDGASASDSTLIDLQVGSTSQFKVDKGGIITANGFLAEGNVDLQGNRLVLDADNDSYINVNGDDSVSIYISGTEVLKFDGAADDKLILDGVSFAPTGAVVGQALGYPNSTTTLEPYTPAGGGDTLKAVNETVTGVWTYDNGFNVGDADTTITRASAGNIQVEGNLIYRAGGTDVPIADGGTGASTADAARLNLEIAEFASRAEAVAATIPAGVSFVRYPIRLRNFFGRDANHLLTFIRDSQSLAATVTCFESADGSRWVPAGTPSVLHFAMDECGMKTAFDPNLLSDNFASLAAAQAVYPEASALTETADDMAFQKCADFIRGSFYYINQPPVADIARAETYGSDRSLFIPRGVYYLSRPWDLTNISLSHTFMNILADGALIYGATAGKPIIDFTGSRKIDLQGKCDVVGIWTSSGVPRIGIQYGRSPSAPLINADSHRISGAWEVRGRFSLAALYNYAAEDFRYGNLALKNELDPRCRHINLDNTSGTLQTGETVTWDGGSSSGILKAVRYGAVSGDASATATAIIRVVTGTLADNDSLTGGTSGATGDVRGTPRTEPSGEGPDGRSYCLVLDGDNYWGLDSDYQTNPAADTAASFLRNDGVIDARHTGRGDAMWVCFSDSFNFDKSYLVSDDVDGGAGIVFFSNTVATANRDFSADVHIESDGGDLLASTGLDYDVKWESATGSRAIEQTGFRFKSKDVHAQTASFDASDSNITSVLLDNCDIEVSNIGRDVSQVMFGSPSKFTVNGYIYCPLDGNGPYLNVSSLADFTGRLLSEDVTSTNAILHTGQYRHNDITGASVYRGDSVVQSTALNANFDGLCDSSTGLLQLRNIDKADSTTVLGQLRHQPSSNQWLFSCNGTSPNYIVGTTSIYPNADGSQDLGLLNRRYRRIFSDGLTLQDGVTAPGTITGHASIYVDAADGDLKIKFADGTVKTIVTDT